MISGNTVSSEKKKDCNCNKLLDISILRYEKNELLYLECHKYLSRNTYKMLTHEYKDITTQTYC